MKKPVRTKSTLNQLANLKGVKNAKPKKEVEDPETPSEKTRRDWEYNDSIIGSAYTELMISKQKLPTYKDIADKCKLSVRTVERHLEHFDFETVMMKFRAGNEKVMLNLFKQAATGKSEKMMRLFFECTGVLKKKLDITTNGKEISSPLAGLVSIDVKKLSDNALDEIIANHEANNS